MIEAIQGVPLEIAFTNSLSEPTLIYWHGLQIPAAMDGTEATQRPRRLFAHPGEEFVTGRFASNTRIEDFVFHGPSNAHGKAKCITWKEK